MDNSKTTPEGNTRPRAGMAKAIRRAAPAAALALVVLLALAAQVLAFWLVAH